MPTHTPSLAKPPRALIFGPMRQRLKWNGRKMNDEIDLDCDQYSGNAAVFDWLIRETEQPGELAKVYGLPDDVFGTLCDGPYWRNATFCGVGDVWIGNWNMHGRQRIRTEPAPRMTGLDRVKHGEKMRRNYANRVANGWKPGIKQEAEA